MPQRHGGGRNRGQQDAEVLPLRRRHEHVVTDDVVRRRAMHSHLERHEGPLAVVVRNERERKDPGAVPFKHSFFVSDIRTRCDFAIDNVHIQFGVCEAILG